MTVEFGVHGDQVREILASITTPEERETFIAEVQTAPDSERERVVWAWHRTMLAMRHPDYHANMTRDVSADPVYDAEGNVLPL